MASTASRPTGEQASAAAPFSYAQAAKGRTASVAPTSTQSSQAASGTNTPSRDTTSLTNASLSASQAVGDSESNKTVQGEAGSNGPKVAPAESESGSKSSQANALSSPSSPSVGSASTSTLPKEEEISLPSNSTAEPAWREARAHNSSAVNTGDRYVEAPEGRRNKNKKGSNNKGNKDAEKKEAEKEKEPVKPEAPLVAAPMPTVNIWAQRIEAAKANKPAGTPTKAEAPITNGVGPGAKSTDQKRRGKTDENERQGQAAKEANKAQKKSGDIRREEPAGKRAAPRGSRVVEKDEKLAPTQLPPSVDDAVSWPTPDTVAEEEKRKVQEKVVKEENEDTSGKEKRQKETWTKIPFTPTAVFNTPIPTRGRGNRGGARGGRDAGGRGGHLANGSSAGDKASMSGMPTGNEGKEQRGRDSSSAGRTASLPPQTSKRASSDDPHASRDQRKQSVAHDKAKGNASQSAKVDQAPFDSDSRRPSLAPVNGAMEFHPGAEYHQNQRQSRADFPQGDKFTQANVEAFGAGGRDQRSGSNARSIDGYNGGAGFGQRGESRAERGRFRGRGNQNSYTNGHVPAGFQNGMPMTNGFPRSGPYSPPLNQPQYGAAYGPPRGRGGRGQSMSGNIYGRFNGANGHHMAPIQTAGPMFGYQGMDPMSAPPFNPYMDQFSMISLVRAQLDYYFSIDNLCKDVYLRKHMDSQGFVYLSFIANFSRMQKLTSDLELIRVAAEGSEIIELAQGSDGIDRLRARNGWESWVMPMEHRAPSAKNEGPSELTHPQTQRAQSALPQGASTFSPNGMEPAFQPYGFQQPAMVPVNGHANGVAQHHESPLSAAVPNFAPGLPLHTVESNTLAAETTFTDQEIESLTVVFGSPSRDEKPFPPTRSFSNGSITDDMQDQENRNSGLEMDGPSDR